MIDVYMTDTITYKKNVSDQWGEVTSTEYTVKARIEYASRMVSSPDTGEQVVSKAVVSVKGKDKGTYQVLVDNSGNEVQISHLDKVRFYGTDYRIVQTTQKKDFSVTYIELVVA